MKKILLSIVTCLVFVNLGYCLDDTSYRVQALGGDFKGLINDDYTDLMINPARIKDYDRNVAAQFGNPMALGYFSSSDFGVLAQYSKSISKNESGSTNAYTYPNYTEISGSTYRSNYNNENINAAIIKGFKFLNNNWGIAILPQRNLSDNRSSNDSQDNYYDNNNILISNNSYSRYDTLKTDDIFSARCDIGWHKVTEDLKENDIVLSASFKNIRRINNYTYYWDANYDPDNNGENMSNNQIASPNYRWQNQTKNYDYPIENLLGYGLKYRVSKKTDTGNTKTFYFDFSWMPDKDEGIYVNRTQSYIVSGTTVTTGDTINSFKTFQNNTDTYSLSMGFGRTIHKDKLMLAFGVHSDATYLKTIGSTQATAPYSTETTQFSYKASIPLGFEFSLLPSVIIRSGISPYISGGTINNTGGPNLMPINNKSETYSQGVVSYMGFGITPYESLYIDFVVSSNKIQARYIF